MPSSRTTSTVFRSGLFQGCNEYKNPNPDVLLCIHLDICWIINHMELCNYPFVADICSMCMQRYLVPKLSVAYHLLETFTINHTQQIHNLGHKLSNQVRALLKHSGQCCKARGTTPATLTMAGVKLRISKSGHIPGKNLNWYESIIPSCKV